MVANARNIAKAVNLPVIADADNGFGNAINIIRTIRDYEEAGVAGIHIEDQVSPKRCGHLAGKEVVAIEEAVGKIRAAVDAKRIRTLSSSQEQMPSPRRVGGSKKLRKGERLMPGPALTWFFASFHLRKLRCPENSPRKYTKNSRTFLCF